MKKIDFKKWKNKLKGLPSKIAEKAFKFFLILFLLDLIIGGIMFYKYSFVTERKEPQANFQQVSFKENTFKNILGIWEQRKDNFEKASTQDFQDLFIIKSSFPELTGLEVEEGE